MILAGTRPAWYTARAEAARRAEGSDVPNEPQEERADEEPRKSAVEIAPRPPSD